MIRNETHALHKRLKDLNCCVREIDSTIEKVQKGKDDRAKEIDTFLENLQAKLVGQLKSKLIALIGHKNTMTGEIE